MSVRTKQLTKSEAHDCAETFRGVPMWIDPMFSAIVGESLFLAATKGGELLALWQLPLVCRSKVLVAERVPRLFPYASPWINPDLTQAARRSVVQALFREAKREVDAIVLPMSPDMQDISGAIEEGAFAEWRHTYRLNVSATEGPPRYDRVIANHVRAAQRVVEVVTSDSCDDFCFEQAIRDNHAENRERRRELALLLARAGKVRVFRGQAGGKPLGEALVVIDQGVAYLYHSWFMSGGTRGVPSLLISHAIRWAREDSAISFFDFEGSIIASIDRFMSIFPGRLAPYPVVYWDRDTRRILERIVESLDIPGRKVV